MISDNSLSPTKILSESQTTFQTQKSMPLSPLDRTMSPVVDGSSFAVSEVLTVEPNASSGESAKARVERLGRQRPEKFKSLGAEVGFIFALSMSQVLSVNYQPPAVRPGISDASIGVLFLRLYCPLAYHFRGLGNTGGGANLAF
jgi:hypothetical protein